MIKTIYQKEEYLNIEALRTPGKPEVFRYERNGEKASYFFYRKYAGKVNDRDYWNIIVSTRGNCGFVFENENPSEEFVKNFSDEFEDYAKRTGIVCEYTKFDWWNNMPNWITNMYKKRLHSYNYTVDLTGDFFMEEFSHSRRHEIRRIMKRGYTVEFVGKESIDVFADLYCNTESKFNIKKEFQCSKEYWEKCFELFPNNCRIELAKKANMAVAATFLMYTEDMMHATFCGVGDYGEMDPTSLMDYEACRFGKNLGCKYYDMGNAPIGEGGLEAYKNSFVKKSGGLPSYVGSRIIDEKIYRKLIEINGRNKEGYFPEFMEQVN